MKENKAYRKDFVLYKGSKFYFSVPLSDIYVPPVNGATPNFEGGAKLKADSTKKFAIIASLENDDKDLTLLVSPTDSTAIEVAGIYNFAIDMTKNGDIYTILVGEITVEEDVSKIA